MKWCGKSAPRLWQQRRHGKPHREQDQIGTAGCVFRVAVRVGRVRCVATHIPEEWSSPRKRYRTRLTGHLTLPNLSSRPAALSAVRARTQDPLVPISEPKTCRPSLRHTKVMGVVLDGAELSSPSWNGLVDAMIRLAKQRLGSFGALKNAAGVNMVEGKKIDQGYRYLSDINVSVQGQDAQDAWRCIAQIATVLKVRVEVYFFWRRNPGAYLPGETANLTINGR